MFTGYYAPRPLAERSAEERRLNAAGLIVGGREGGELDAWVLAAPFRAEGERAYVPVLIEIGGAALLAGNRSGQVPTELYAYAIDSEGSIEDHFTHALVLDVEKVGSALSQSGVKFWGHFDLPPGDYVLDVQGDLSGQPLDLGVPFTVSEPKADEQVVAN